MTDPCAHEWDTRDGISTCRRCAAQQVKSQPDWTRDGADPAAARTGSRGRPGMDNLPRQTCTALAKSTGQRCRSNPIKGGTVCIKHGGAAPQVRAKANRRLQEAEAALAVQVLGGRRDITPTEALLEEVQWTAGHVAWLRERLHEQATDDLTSSPWYTLYLKERDHLVVATAAALRAGVEERRVQLAEHQGSLLASAITRILDALHLTPTQAELVPTVVPQILRQIGAS